MVRAVLQPVSGTFELRWQWHRGDGQPPDGDPQGAEGQAREPALVGDRPRLDEVAPTP